MKKALEWPPKKGPGRFPLSVHRDGWVKSIGGRVRFICGKLPPRQAMARYHERMTAGDFSTDKEQPQIRVNDHKGLTVKELSNRFMAWLRQRVETRRPRPLDVRTYDDYRLTLQAFANTPFQDDEGRTFRLAGAVAHELGPRQFSAFAARIPGDSPYTTARYVAYVKAMYAWAVEADEIPHPVKYGADFKKPAKEEMDVARADLEKVFAPAEVRKLVAAADPALLAWTLLGINCAFANADIGKLTRDAVDLDRGLIAFRRGKRGRAYRKCPLMAATVEALRAYERPDKAKDDAHADLFFLTPTGLPYTRTKHHRDANGMLIKGVRIDTTGNVYQTLMTAAGVQLDGRSFSGLRTTFRTIADRMPQKDNDAIDLVMGHKRRHISREYVEDFSLEKLHAVVEFVWWQLFDGWTMQVSELPRAQAPADAVAVAA